MTMRINSSAFDEGGMIPSQYTCDKADVSPPLEWSGVPAQAKSLALICDDPDAPSGTWVHWVIYNMPAHSQGMSEHVPAQDTLADGSVQGTNDFRRLGYGGPCPPGGTHRYYFKLYALDSVIELPPGATKMQLLQAMGGHILAEARLIGRYKH